MKHNIVEKIRSILVNELGVNTPATEIGLEDGLQAIHGLDSIGFIELRFQCEQAFNVSINDEHFVPQSFKNLTVLSSLIEQLQTSKLRD
jgi:acyl carrier protein